MDTAMTEANREKPIGRRHLVGHEDHKRLPQCPKVRKVPSYLVLSRRMGE